MGFCSRVYRDADGFLRARKIISRIIIPYNQCFKRSTFKIIIVLLIAVVVPFPAIRNISAQNDPHLTLLLLQYSEMALVTLTGVVCYVWAVMKVKSIEKIHKSILYTHKLFQSFQKRALVYSTKWMFTYDILVAIIGLIYAATQLIGSNPVTGNKLSTHGLIDAILGTFSYSMPVILVHCLGSFFRSCLYALVVQLTQLNRLLNRLGVLKTAHVENLVYTHCYIGNTFKQLNAAQTLPVLLLSSCTFFVVVYNLYDMLTFNLEESLNNTLGDNIGGAAWIGFWTSQLVVLVILIENVVDKHEEFISCLHYKIIQDFTGNLGKSNRLMAHLAVKQKLEYSAAGFFVVDYKLICSIASSATTYLVILIQFAQLNVGTKKAPGDTYENDKTIHNNVSTVKPTSDSIMLIL